VITSKVKSCGACHVRGLGGSFLWCAFGPMADSGVKSGGNCKAICNIAIRAHLNYIAGFGATQEDWPSQNVLAVTPAEGAARLDVLAVCIPP
jgi:hypothetical protein